MHGAGWAGGVHLNNPHGHGTLVTLHAINIAWIGIYISYVVLLPIVLGVPMNY